MTMLEYDIEMLVLRSRIHVSCSPLLEMISAKELHDRSKPESSDIGSCGCEGKSDPCR